ncbi:DUF4214 domain-containing protein [Pseudoduganella sp. LjRoot289]|uniref:DUF4214 domain-containing protein n=1 Tax=Pseudoduganella sp. LjRoot289 TaxID=3342314 RepID=UPI003ECE299B
MPTDDYSANTSTTASLQPGGQASAAFEAQFDSDWFRVSLTAGRFYTFGLDDGGSRSALQLAMVDASGNYQSFSSTSTTTGVTGTFRPSASADYFLAASNYSAFLQNVPYTITASSGTPDDTGDTQAAARAIALDESVSGAFEGPQDVDQFKLALQAGTTYTVSTTWASDNGSSWYGGIAVSGPDGAVQSGSRSNFNQVSFTTGSAGDYYISAGSAWGTALGSYTLLASAAADDHGATVDSAGALAIGTSTAGKLELPYDRDWYAVSLQAGKTYWFTLSGGAANDYIGGTQLKLLDGAGQALTTLSGSLGYLGSVLMPCVASASGTYYVEVADQSSGSGGYTLKAQLGTPDDRGNTVAAAGTLALGTAFSGKLEIPADKDVFKLAVKAGTSYVLELTAQSAADAAGYTLDAQDANGGYVQTLAYSSATASVYKTFTAGYTGDFYLTVDRYADDRASAYTLKASLPAADDYAASSATAAVLQPGGAFSGKTDYAGDVDWVKLSLNANDKIVFQLQGLAGTALEARSAAGSYAYLNTLYGAGPGYYSLTADVAGDYYLAVTPPQQENTARTGAYTLQSYVLTSDKTGPAVLSYSPASGAANASLTGKIVLNFDERIMLGQSAITLLDSTGAAVETYYGSYDNHLQLSGSTLLIDPEAPLRAGTTYTLQLGAGAITDLAGNNHVASTGYSFSTAASVPQGGAGNDYLTGLGTALRLEGGAGVDTAVYAGSLYNYRVVHVSNESKVTNLASSPNGNGGDVLTGVERLLFRDSAVALDLDGAAGQAYRMYQAALNRTPDKAGLGYWIAQLDSGITLAQVADGFIGSAEFKTLFGSAPGDDSFVRSLYTNVLHRAPDQAGLDFWLGSLSGGLGRADALASFSESAENQAAAIQVIGNGFEYTPFG